MKSASEISTLIQLASIEIADEVMASTDQLTRTWLEMSEKERQEITQRIATKLRPWAVQMAKDEREQERPTWGPGAAR